MHLVSLAEVKGYRYSENSSGWFAGRGLGIRGAAAPEVPQHIRSDNDSRGKYC